MERKIYRLSEEDYANLAQEVLGRLMSPSYFTGVVEVVGHDDYILRLTASLILYRGRISDRSILNPDNSIWGVSAVWWDLVCEGDEGIICDDFDFEKFTEFIIEE